MYVNVNLVDIKDLFLFNTGELFESYRIFGSHHGIWNGVEGVRFVVWAPHAVAVRIVGDFNAWDSNTSSGTYAMHPIDETGVWIAFVPGLGEGAVYKYEIETAQGAKLLKSDPFAFYSELRPNTASIVTRLDRFTWSDDEWQRQKQESQAYTQTSSLQRPMLIYEVHLGSWKIRGREQFYSYSELADQLIGYAKDMGYTHLELMPLAEHPLDASWGYQTTGYYSATSRYGTPEQLMELVDRAHAVGIGVILDWVPGHFCKDAHGLRLFDGSPLFEPADSRLAEKPLWGTLAFDFAKTEVQSFLISNAVFWLDVFHIDGLRVDAVASMLDQNFDKPESMWTYNENGGSEHKPAVQFLKKLNETLFHRYPGTLMMAEDSSNYPLVCAPISEGGLGFGYKWNMGWMNDMLRYMQHPPEQRRHYHNLLTFSMMYAYSEHFVLPLSHDEVVHGKLSLLNKMPGEYLDKFANLRLFLAYWITHPGKKLLFMGAELAQFAEWKDADQLDWLLLDYESHRGFHQFSRQLNLLYTSHPALWELDCEPEGFAWIDPDNAQQSVVSFVRYGRDRSKPLVVVCNFSAQAYERYRIGVPLLTAYEQLFSTDSECRDEEHVRVGASAIHAEAIPWHRCSASMEFALPGLACVIFSTQS